MDGPDAIGDVLAAYPGDWRSSRIEPLAGGGFSGARLWKLHTSAGPFCLREWPAEHPSGERLEFIHAVLRHVNQQRFRLAPAPIDTRARRGYALHAGRFWEITPWLPGEADSSPTPSAARLAAAFEALARFHRTAESFLATARRRGPSRGIAERIARIDELRQGGASRLRKAIVVSASSGARQCSVGPGASRLPNAVSAADWPSLAPRAIRLLSLFEAAAPSVGRSLAPSAAAIVPLQPAIRDIWREHVLFTGDAVTGLVDFGAMRIESVAADVARLAGSLAGDDAAGWQAALAAYEAVRPLSGEERRLVAAFDRSGVLLSGLQWLAWIYLEGRTFARPAAVEARLDEILGRLERLVETPSPGQWRIGEDGARQP